MILSSYSRDIGSIAKWRRNKNQSDLIERKLKSTFLFLVPKFDILALYKGTILQEKSEKRRERLKGHTLESTPGFSPPLTRSAKSEEERGDIIYKGSHAREKKFLPRVCRFLCCRFSNSALVIISDSLDASHSHALLPCSDLHSVCCH